MQKIHTSCLLMQVILHNLEAVECPKDLRPIGFTSGLFSEMQQRWSATEKEMYAVHQYVLKFALNLRGAKCVLCCNYKLLEPFLSKGIKIPKLNRWSMELAGYDITFIHIKGKNNVPVDAISRLKTLNISKEPFENSKAQVVITHK